jgi:hypothetical protein
VNTCDTIQGFLPYDGKYHEVLVGFSDLDSDTTRYLPKLSIKNVPVLNGNSEVFKQDLLIDVLAIGK